MCNITLITNVQEYGKERRKMCLWPKPKRCNSMVHQATSEVIS